MNQMLKIKQNIHMKSSGAACEVEHLIGSGSQGEVYQVALNGKSFALKWYHPYQATNEQRLILENLIPIGPPNKNFLWPLDIVTGSETAGFGYLMPLREKRYKNVADLMKGRIDPNFTALATAGLQLADSFLQLHTKGLCYRDISHNNIFFDPMTGDILICDNDNVTIDGDTSAAIAGTPHFMAPEVVRGDASPGTQTDLFSLAVLLFYLFMMHHPLDGKKESDIRCLDLPAMTKIYGTEPVFIFDPRDNSNQPVPGLHDNALAFWPIYPQFLRDLFVKAFTNGIHDPQQGRVRESEWRAAMVCLRDSICYCGSCGRQSFYDISLLQTGNGNRLRCWSCGKQITLPPRMRISKSTVMLNYDTKLYPHHVDGGRMYDFSQTIAEVVSHPKDPSVWGLKNLSQDRWVITGADGINKDVDPGRSVTVASGVKINFGTANGEIRL